MKQFILGSLFSAALVFAAVGHTGPWHGKGHHGPQRMAEQLDLSEEQQVQFEAIHEQLQEQANKRMLRFAMKGLMNLDPESTEYNNQVQQLAEQQADALRQAVITAGEAHAKVYALLTPEQREKAKELKSQMRDKRKAKGAKHHHGEKG